MPAYSDRTQTEDSGGSGFVTIPAIGGTPLPVPVRSIVVLTAGNLSVVLADGSNNSANVIPVTASPYPLPYGVVALATNNTAVIIGLR